MPRKYRHDGWTPERQRAFIEALADTGSVKAAAKRVNMSPEGAYQLRREPGAESLCIAWNAAVDHGVQKLADIAMDRAVEGVPDPVYWRGEKVGEKRRYNDRLVMFLLKHHLPNRFGATAMRNGTKSPETLEREQAETEAWLAEQCRRLGLLLGAQRRWMRRAVIAMLIGDQPTAAHFEDKAHKIEDIIARPEDWELIAGLTPIDEQIERDYARRGGSLIPDDSFEDDNRWCRDYGAGSDPEGDSEPVLPTLFEQPRDEKGMLLPRLPLPDVIRSAPNVISCGPTLSERETARRDAVARIALAQAEWVAAKNEETWREWQAGG